MSIRLKIKLFIVLLFMSAIVNSIFIFTLERHSEEKLDWVSHTNEVLLTAEKLLGSLKDMETGQRGYLLTSEHSYLAPYHRGSVESKEYFGNLKFLTQDNDEQQGHLEVILKYMNLKYDELAETIELAHNNDHKEDNKMAIEIVKKNNGKEFMDKIRSNMTDFIHHELLLLEKRKGDFREHKVMVSTLIIIEVVVFILLAIFSLMFLNKNLFDPLTLLLTGTKKMENGEKISVTDITSKDEMGCLLASFYKMNEIVNNRAENLDYLANHDELTGLKNRKQIDSFIKNAVLNAKKSNTKTAVLFIDLNKFKLLNDTLGHEAGDTMLVEVASRLKSSVRSDDTVFRIGGDEFVILLNELHNKSEVEKVVNNILESCKESLVIKGQSTEIFLSIGIAIAPDDSQDDDKLLTMSDVAMYEAKNDPQTHYKFFTKDMLKRTND